MDDSPKKSENAGGLILACITGSLRSAAQAHPMIAPLGQAWSEYESYKTGKRIQELIDNLASDVEALKQKTNAGTQSIQAPAYFAELLERTVEKVRKEFNEAIRAKYARLLATIVVEGDESKYAENMQLIESLEALSELDLRVLSLFKGNNDKSIGSLNTETLGLEGDINAQTWEVASSLGRLESRGLLVKTAPPPSVVYVQRGLNEDTARWRQTKYLLLPIGQLLIESIVD